MRLCRRRCHGLVVRPQGVAAVHVGGHALHGGHALLGGGGPGGLAGLAALACSSGTGSCVGRRRAWTCGAAQGCTLAPHVPCATLAAPLLTCREVCLHASCRLPASLFVTEQGCAHVVIAAAHAGSSMPSQATAATSQQLPTSHGRCSRVHHLPLGRHVRRARHPHLHRPLRPGVLGHPQQHMWWPVRRVVHACACC